MKKRTTREVLRMLAAGEITVAQAEKRLLRETPSTVAPKPARSDLAAVVKQAIGQAVAGKPQWSGTANRW